MIEVVVVVTCNVENKITGMLRSVFHEIAPGVFVSVDLSARSFDRVWQVIDKWFREGPNKWVVGLTSDKTSVERYKVRSLGQPKREWAEIDGFHILKIRDLVVESQ